MPNTNQINVLIAQAQVKTARGLAAHLECHGLYMKEGRTEALQQASTEAEPDKLRGR